MVLNIFINAYVYVICFNREEMVNRPWISELLELTSCHLYSYFITIEHVAVGGKFVT